MISLPSIGRMKIIVDDEIYLDLPDKKDKQNLISYLTDKEIYNNTLRLPYPYTARDAEWWIRYVDENRRKTGMLINFAIRNKGKKLIGGISYHLKYGMNSHKDELGYWLARDYWNKGIMSRVVKSFCRYGFDSLHLVRIEATVFEHNLSSARVLEKCGFEYEGTLRKYYIKDGNFIDVRLYSIIK
ncbi:MAG TPA: GNAT family protein [Ignavibacteriaceae bacterium]|jgi:ribosomal-protein-alanine N-acetyltransferase|nr:GNAT family protein [Ignavibacteriaceae bacterium]